MDRAANFSVAHHGHLVALIAANLYVIFFNGTWGPVMWVMLGEMFPNQIRGSALAVAGFAQWFANYLIAQTFRSWQVEFTGSYLFYAISAVISFFLVQGRYTKREARNSNKWKVRALALIGLIWRRQGYSRAKAAAAPNRPGSGCVINLTGISSMRRSKRPLAMNRSRKPDFGR